MIENFPFMLSASKHSEPFFGNLLGVIPTQSGGAARLSPTGPIWPHHFRRFFRRQSIP